MSFYWWNICNSENTENEKVNYFTHYNPSGLLQSFQTEKQLYVKWNKSLHRWNGNQDGWLVLEAWSDSVFNILPKFAWKLKKLSVIESNAIDSLGLEIFKFHQIAWAYFLYY